MLNIMNIQTAFIYSVLTFIVIYGVQTLDNNYFAVEKPEERTFRNSVLCSVITWVIIVYFIYRAEIEVPILALKNQQIFDGAF